MLISPLLLSELIISMFHDRITYMCDPLTPQPSHDAQLLAGAVHPETFLHRRRPYAGEHHGKRRGKEHPAAVVGRKSRFRDRFLINLQKVVCSLTNSLDVTV